MGDDGVGPDPRPGRVTALPVRTPPPPSMMRSILRRLRGALGLGAFGSVVSVAFGSFVKTLAFLFHGTPLDLLGSLPALATGGLVAGLLASLGLVAASRGRRALDGARVFLAGFPVAAVTVLLLRGDALVGAGVPGLFAFGAFVVVGGSVIGLVGTAAWTIADAAPDGDAHARTDEGAGLRAPSPGRAPAAVADRRDAPVS